MSSFNPEGAYGTAPPKKSGAGKIILIVLGVFGGLGLLCCGGFALMAWWGLGQVDALVGAELRKELDASPKAIAELGPIESLKWNMMKTGQYSQDTREENVLVFDVKASNASGDVICKFDQSSGGAEPAIRWAKLRKSDGTEVDLISEGFEIEMGNEIPQLTP
jgi:hypothetical protein